VEVIVGNRAGAIVQNEKILVYLPSPMGDAVLCTPALRGLRRRFESCDIYFLANSIVRSVFSLCNFNDHWLESGSKNPFAIAGLLWKHNFSRAILFKNSFASALAVWLARIPERTGYVRENRGFLLTEKLYPPRLNSSTYKPVPMIDYYLAIASWLGADTTDRRLELCIDPQDTRRVLSKLPMIANSAGPTVVLVPGGSFGPSKCWPAERFAQTADKLCDDYDATVVVSVAPNKAEQQIAKKICGFASHKLVNLGEIGLSLGELKSVISLADLVICNDTGPRHIAIALQRKVITLFGPNNPVWTDSGYANEIQIVGKAVCAPCEKPRCKKTEHLCMEAITTGMVCDAASKLLEKQDCPRNIEGDSTNV